MDYIFHLLILCAIYAVLATSANLNLRWTGLFNVAIATFFGIGAYTAALVPSGNSFSDVVGTMILCGMSALLVSFGISFTLRVLRGDYFALATLAFGVVFVSLLRNSVRGISGIERPAVFAFEMLSYDSFPYFVLAVSAGLIWIVHRVTHSALGFALLAQSRNPAPLETMGYNVFALRVLSLALSAFCAGVAGCLYAWHIGVVAPNGFTIGQSFTIISMAVIGGSAAVWGAPVGALIILMVPELIGWLNPGGINVQIASEILAASAIVGIILLRRLSENTDS
jgi:branched-chain amino acid transport system permease protein